MTHLRGVNRKAETTKRSAELDLWGFDLVDVDRMDVICGCLKCIDVGGTIMTLEERIRQIEEARRIDRACQEMIMQKVEEARRAGLDDLEQVGCRTGTRKGLSISGEAPELGAGPTHSSGRAAA
jgi:hypothetical protein